TWFLPALFVIAAVSLTSCFKKYEEDFLFRDFQVEFDLASWQSDAPGKTYPIAGPYDKGSGTITFQVNLIGGQKPTAQTLRYKIVPEESTAQEGYHFSLADNGTFEIPANSSFGYVTINILDFPPQTGTAVLVLDLVGNDEIKVSENYKRIGISISLTGPPSTLYPLHTQIGADAYYNSIVIDIMHPGLPADFKNRWAQFKNNLYTYSTGGRLPYSMQIRFGENNQVRVSLIYATLQSVDFSYAYASWLYEFVPDAQGRGHFVFQSSVDGNGNNLRGAGVTAPILENWLEQNEFQVDWVSPSVATPRQGAMLGGLFQVSNPNAFMFGELGYFNFGTNARNRPSSPAFTELLDNGNGGYFTSILVDPESPAQSQKFRDLWNAGKATIISTSAGRILNQFMISFDGMFNDVLLTMAYANSTSTSKLLGTTRYWMWMTHDGELTFEYIHRNANAGVTSPPEIFDNYLNVKTFKVTRNGNTLVFTDKTDPSSYFVGTLGDLARATGSFSWWF
ncbi:MAG TPA: hypothetical protein VIK74_03615, partial [Parasegetibacter sp.]